MKRAGPTVELDAGKKLHSATISVLVERSGIPLRSNTRSLLSLYTIHAVLRTFTSMVRPCSPYAGQHNDGSLTLAGLIGAGRLNESLFLRAMDEQHYGGNQQYGNYP